MSILKLEEIKSLQGTGNTVITFDSSDRAVFAQPPLTAVPAFRAYMSTTQAISSVTETKVNIDTKTGAGFFDTNAYFDTTNKRYVPQIAGYYQVNGLVRCGGSSQTVQYAAFYKNGTRYLIGEVQKATTLVHVVASDVIYLNGTTDYVELYGSVTATSPTFNFVDSSATCIFSGFLVRAGAA
jgi:hypothetical protein